MYKRQFWYSGIVSTFQPLVHVRRDGTPISSTTLEGVGAVQDLVNADGTFHYLINDDRDRIVRVDPGTGASSDLVVGVHEAPYSLGFDGRYLAVAVAGRIRRFDPASGALVADDPFAVPGWITAIAFVR